MSYPINYPTPQGANIQIFREGGSTSNWVKPQGASFVWFTLIGAGGGGGGVDATDTYFGAGGGSGAVTNCLVPAFLIPDELQINVGLGGTAGTTAVAGGNGTDTTILYKAKDGTGYTLLNANSGNGGGRGTTSNAPSAAGGSASSSTSFSAAGLYQSIDGQASSTGGISLAASTTTFLSAGSANTSSANYGYALRAGSAGLFQLQPIIVGAAASTPGVYNKGGNGCGGNSNGTLGVCGAGGDGIAVIISW